MQDVAPPHCSTIVRDWLIEKLPNRWIGRGADTNLNTKWQDLTPCNFFLWGYIKSEVYDSQPNNMDELKTRIQNAFGDVTREMLRNSMVLFQNRLNLVIQSNGRQAEL